MSRDHMMFVEKISRLSRYHFCATDSKTPNMLSSRRSLLAALWSVVGLLTISSFIIATIFAVVSNKYEDDNEQGGDEYNVQQSAIGVSSRAMVFAAVSSDVCLLFVV